MLKNSRIAKRSFKIIITTLLLFYFLPTQIYAVEETQLPSIFFRFGESEVKEWYRGNEVSMHKIHSFMSSFDYTKIKKIEIIGSSSPEGPISYNKQLSINRANFLKNYLINTYDIPDTLIDVKGLYQYDSSNGNPKDLRYALLNIDTSTILTRVKGQELVLNSDTDKGSNSGVSEPKNFMFGLDYFGWIKKCGIVVILVAILLTILLAIAFLFFIIKFLIPFLRTYRLGAIVPSGNDGINNEGYTLRQLSRNIVPTPLVEKLRNRTDLPEKSKKKILRDIKRSGSFIVPSKAKNKSVDFSRIALKGINSKLPDKETLVSLIIQKNAPIEISEIKADHIRAITYDIVRNDVAKRYGITVAQAGKLIGELDLAPHETEDGFIQLVPNNIHRFKNFYAHKGYVSHMLKRITGKEMAYDE